MPAVHTFWQLPKEEKELFLSVEKESKMVGYSSVWVEDKSILFPRSLVEMLESDTVDFQFGLESQMDFHVTEEKYFDGKQLFGIRCMTSPLLGYSRGQLIANRLIQSNLCAYWTMLSQDQRSVIEQNPEFVSWGKKVFQKFRRHTPQWHNFRGYRYRITRQAEEAFLRGEIDLVPY